MSKRGHRESMDARPRGRLPRLTSDARSPHICATAQSLRRRISPDRLGAAPWLFGVLAASVLLFAKLAEGVAERERLVSVDGEVAASLHAHVNGLLTGAFSAVTRLGSAQVLVPIILLAILFLVRRQRRAHAAFVAAALAGSEALNLGLKAAFARPRPSFADPLATAAGFAFPSGHAMVSFAVYGALAVVILSTVKSLSAKGLVIVSALALVLAIGASRIYLGVHYFSDVAAGYSAGLAWLVVCALTVFGGLLAPAPAGE